MRAVVASNSSSEFFVRFMDLALALALEEIGRAAKRAPAHWSRACGRGRAHGRGNVGSGRRASDRGRHASGRDGGGLVALTMTMILVAMVVPPIPAVPAAPAAIAEAPGVPVPIRPAVHVLGHVERARGPVDDD